jgi:hypothetical protein
MIRNKKKIAVFALALVMIMATTISYAWWVGTRDASDTWNSNLVLIGEAGDASLVITETSSTYEDGMRLVPTGRIRNAETEIETIAYTASAVWTDGENSKTNYTGILSHTIVVMAGEGDDGQDVTRLFNVNAEYDDDMTVNAAATEITITIRMNEPANEEEYNLIAAQSVYFIVTFNVTVPQSA